MFSKIKMQNFAPAALLKQCEQDKVKNTLKEEIIVKDIMAVNFSI